MRLTKKRIEGLDYDPDGPSQQIEWDDQVENFGVRLYESGTKSFVIRYRNEHGRRRYMTLGKFGTLTLQQARKLALDEFYEIRQGEDPVEEKRRADAKTVEAMVEAFVEKHCKPRRNTWETDESRLHRHVVDRWGTRQPESLTRRDISELHRDIGEDAQVEANRVVETIRTMFNFAQDEGIVEDGFNPATKVNKFKEKSRDRWLRPHEIEPLSEALDAVDNIFMRRYYWLLLLTATRRNEMLEARWEHVDLQRRELFLPDTKNGTDHTVPLSDAAFQMLVDLPRQDGNPWVFCSHIEGQRIQEVNQRWRRVRADAGLEDVVLHDFRRTAASWLAQAGYSELIIKKLLNHTVDGPTSIYARMDPSAVREAVNDYGRRVMAAARGEETEVVAIGQARGER